MGLFGSSTFGQVLGFMTLGPFDTLIGQQQQAQKTERDAMRRQEQAQHVAFLAAERQQQQNQENINRQNRRAPDPTALLGDQMSAGKLAMASVLSGPLGVASDRLKLGGPSSLLGT